LPVDLQIIVIDDGSTDGTSQILGALEDSTVQVVRHPTNLGKGAAIRTALQHVRGELVLIQDADLEYDPEDWPRLLRPLPPGLAGRRPGSADPGSLPGGYPTMSLPNVSAVLVTYNSAAYLPDCLRSLRLEGVTDVVVVDNASTDGSAGIVRAHDPEARVIEAG